MSRMAIRLRTASFAMLLGLGASNAFAQSPAEFIEQASAKGMADIETSRMAQRENLVPGNQGLHHRGDQRAHLGQPALGGYRQEA